MTLPARRLPGRTATTSGDIHAFTHRIIAVLAVAFSALLVVPTAANADTPGYVTRREYRRAHEGMSIRRVHRIFDTRGRQVMFFPAGGGLPAEQDREYRNSSPNGYVSVTFIRYAGTWRLDNKFGSWW